MKQQQTPIDLNIGLYWITNIFKATIITAASNTRKPRVAIAWAILKGKIYIVSDEACLRFKM
jgi:hypothetical protein